MQGIYTYIPETNHVPRKYSVAVILLFLFMVHTSLAPVFNLLHFYISTFRSVCAVPNMAVFCSSLTSSIAGTLPRYFLNDFEMVPVAPIITGITFVFTFHLFYCYFSECQGTKNTLVRTVHCCTGYRFAVFRCTRMIYLTMLSASAAVAWGRVINV